MRKYIKKAVSVMFSFSILATSITGFAYHVDYPGGNSDFQLTGASEEKMAGQVVTLKVENNSTVLYTRQTTTDQSGEYTFAFNVLEDSYGDLNLTVNVDGETTPSEMYKSSPDEVARALASLSANGIYATVSAADEVTGNSVSKILQVNAADFTESGLMTTYISGKTYASLTSFQDAYKIGTFLCEFEKTSGNDEVLYEKLGRSKLLDSLSGNALAIFKSYEKAEQISTLNEMRGNRFTSDESFNNALVEAVILNELSKVSTDNEKWSILKNNNDYLELNISKYENASVFSALKKNLFENPITSVSLMKSDIERIYTELTTEPGEDDRGGGKVSSASSSFVKPPEASGSFGFNDLVGYDWAQEAILSLASEGIINGKGNQCFAPGDNITRAEFTKIIVGAFGKLSNSAEANFLDVPKEHWSYRYVASAVSKNIVNGVSEEKFNPDGNITRQDMAVICYRVLAKEMSSENAQSFVDKNDISDYATKAVEVLSSLGIINGKGDGNFAPKDYATRAEAAKIIYSLKALG